MTLAAFRSVTLVGGVIPPDALTRAADLAMPGQSADDYELTPGLTVNAAAATGWGHLLVAWQQRQTALQAARGEAATRLTRDRWLLPLLAELGYERRVPALPAGVNLPPGVGDTKPTHYPLSHQVACPPGDPKPTAAIAIHLVGDDVSLDTRTAGVTARAPHAMLQEFLNRSDPHLYALLSNGRTLRLLRDASSLVKQAYLDFDLDLMFREQLFADFRLLFLTLHATRLTPRAIEPRETAPRPEDGTDTTAEEYDDSLTGAATARGPLPAECWLEQWRVQAINDGSRARDQLETAVAAAITALGTGFVSHPDNDKLRAALADNTDTDQDLRRWLLRIVYRFIILFVAEDRELLHVDDTSPASEAARTLYKQHFSTARLRDLAATRNGTRHGDLWDGHRVVTDALGGEGADLLALPPLAPSLYGRHSIGLLCDAHLSNRYLLEAIRHLSQVKDRTTGVPRRVDYRNLDSEELGGVYEGLLAYVPRYDPERRTFTLALAAGSERKKSGSYYTPSELIALVLDEALDPLIDTALRQANPEHALLSLTVCDPACGSGHFLVAAARRIARALAVARSGDPEPTPVHLRTAMRDVVARCIYGVDLNDLAIEVTRVALWLEALTPGKPFAFLDHHLKVGNALLGTTPRLLTKNVPDEAFVVLIGDDKERTSKLKARNKAARKHAERQASGQFAWDTRTLEISTSDLTKRVQELDTSAGETIADIRARADAWRRLTADADLQNARLVHDAWCTAFVQFKETIPSHKDQTGFEITFDVLQQLRQDPSKVAPETHHLVTTAARQYRFFHWHLEFPGIFTVPELPDANTSPQGWNGGFSAIIGNPPWENFRPMDKEFFAAVGRTDIVEARTSAIRARMIEALKDDDPALYDAYWTAQREFMGTVQLLADTGRFPLTGRGNLTTHDLFAEHCRDTTASHGSSGLIVPTSIMTGSQTAPFVADLIDKQQVGAFYDFANTKKIFPDVDSRYRFGVLRITGIRRPSITVPLAFHLTDPGDLSADRLIILDASDLARINPNTKNLPVFASPKDATITAGVHRRHPVLRVLDDPAGNPWNIALGDMFHMSHEAHLFSSAHDVEAKGATFNGFTWRIANQHWMPLYEGKHVWHYDHRYSTGQGAEEDKVRAVQITEHDQPGFEILTRHYVAESEIDRKLRNRTQRQWLMGWRDISSATNQRTFIPAIFPRVAAGNKLPLLEPDKPEDSVALLAAMSSLPCDYVLRQKSSGTSVLKFMVNQVPVPHPDTFSSACPWDLSVNLHTWIRPRVIELVYTSRSLQLWAEDLDDSAPPFRWSPERRATLQAELDAAMFHVYGLDRGEVEHVLDSFRALRDAEIREHGEFRTRRLVLETYDGMAMCGGPGRPTWASTLDPQPGRGPRHPAAR